MTPRAVLEALTVLTSIKTINVMNNPKANKEVKYYMKGAVYQALKEISDWLESHKKHPEMSDMIGEFGWDYCIDTLKKEIKA